MTCTVSVKDKHIHTAVELVSSKSISNRALIIRFLSNNSIEINNLSASADTQILTRLLHQIHTDKKQPVLLDAGAAGTTFRFLTALLAITRGEYLLTGSARMKERPIGTLVKTLCTLGADISYDEKEGYPPLKISGKKIAGGAVSIDSTISSQFISALLMIAPCFEKGLQLTLTGATGSLPYIEMTLKLMGYFGIHYSWDGQTIEIKKQAYVARSIHIEPDWSAASYWYEIAALSEEAGITLQGLQQGSLQGDRVIAVLMKQFGVHTSFSPEGVHLQKEPHFVLPRNFSFDFTHCPDLVQTVAVTAAAQGVHAELKGVQSLRIKETDRIEALRNELQKTGTMVIEKTGGVIEIIPGSDTPVLPLTFNTYGDHRMAMAFAPLALKWKEVRIEDPAVTEKSYPSFWNDLERAGFCVYY